MKQNTKAVWLVSNSGADVFHACFMFHKDLVTHLKESKEPWLSVWKVERINGLQFKGTWPTTKKFN